MIPFERINLSRAVYFYTTDLFQQKEKANVREERKTYYSGKLEKPESPTGSQKKTEKIVSVFY